MVSDGESGVKEKMKDVKKSNMKGATNQREFIEEIAERVAGYLGGASFAVLEYDIYKTETFNSKADAFIGKSEVTLELRIDVKDYQLGDKKE